MTEPQLRSYLGSFSNSPSPVSSHISAAENDGDVSPLPSDLHIEGVSPLTSVPPTPPIPIQPNTQAGPSVVIAQDQPLFPPSPPGTIQRETVEHPLRILSRAVRELREAVEKLEQENEALRLIKEAGGVRAKRTRQADQVSHDSFPSSHHSAYLPGFDT
jgi:hypothetical protein